MKLINWLKESNRLSHLKVGFGIWVLIVLINLVMYGFSEGTLDFNDKQCEILTLIGIVNADINVLASMCSVEYTQKLCGNKWDWLDILAGCLPGILLTLVITLLILI